MGGRGGSSARGGGGAGGGGALPELTGTERQVAWANDIRERALGDLGSSENSEFVRNAILQQSDAKWFIDNRRGIIPQSYREGLRRELAKSGTEIAGFGNSEMIAYRSNGRSVGVRVDSRYGDHSFFVFYGEAHENYQTKSISDAISAARTYLRSGSTKTGVNNQINVISRNRAKR